LAAAARKASRILSRSSAQSRTSALDALAKEIRSKADTICAANERDMAAGRQKGLSEAMLDRLALSPDRLEGMARAIEDIARQNDPIGRLEEERTLKNGLQVARMRIPLGVVLMIYESRPNVTTDAAALCLRSGNAVILRGGSEAFHSNSALGECVQAALAKAGLPATAVQMAPSTDRDFILHLLGCDKDIDLVIPRGGEGLIQFVSEHSRIPVLKHDRGVCHVYVHAKANLETALRICENAKVQRPGTCNAAETILIDRAVAKAFVPMLCERFAALGVEIRGDETVVELGGKAVVPAKDSDWGNEFLAKIVAVRVVDGYSGAIDHIERYGSNHTECIVTESQEDGERFLREVGSSTVLVNTSTRFADGGELGLGAEVGISTTRLHAYGPMGVDGLTATKFIVRGQGQVRT
jgi:glutamate-5-semialdehyde dehydrogenase